MQSHKGFTLLELLVVIAIIGLLSTMVLASLRGARLKAMDAQVKEQALALRNLMELERTDVGHYGNFKSAGAWKAAGASCTVASFGSSPHATKAAEICTKLVEASGPNCGSYCSYFANVAIPGMPPGQNNPNTAYTIQAYLPGASADAAAAGLNPSIRYLCLGSSGNQSIADGAAWTESGCQQNP